MNTFTDVQSTHTHTQKPDSRKVQHIFFEAIALYSFPTFSSHWICLTTHTHRPPTPSTPPMDRTPTTHTHGPPHPRTTHTHGFVFLPPIPTASFFQLVNCSISDFCFWQRQIFDAVGRGGEKPFVLFCFFLF